MKIFFVTRISGNKSIIFFWPYVKLWTFPGLTGKDDKRVVLRVHGLVVIILVIISSQEPETIAKNIIDIAKNSIIK